MKILSKVLNIFKKDNEYNDRKLYHLNGKNDSYPDEVELIIESSITAAKCNQLMSRYILGKGFGENANNFIVDTIQNKTLLDFSGNLTSDIAMHRGAFIHVNYGVDASGNIIKTGLRVLDFCNCRVGFKDSNGYFGKILYNPNIKKCKKSDIIEYNIFNDDPLILEQQINEAGGIREYNGQVFYINLSNKIYPLSNIHQAILDADSESQSSIYKNRSLRDGFFGKKLCLTKPLVDTALQSSDNKEDINEYAQQLSERDYFRKNLEEMVGADNSGNLLHLELEPLQDENLEDVIKFIDIQNNIDDKVFEYTERSVRENIALAYNNIPLILISANQSGIFGNSGEQLRQAKIFYQEQIQQEQNVFIQSIERVLNGFLDFENISLDFEKLVEENQQQNQTTNNNQNDLEDDNTNQ